MSNRLTFSLASLVLILALVAIPAMAHDNVEGGNFADHASAGHMHPVIEVTITDADPNTLDTIEVVDTDEDTEAAASLVPTIQFDVTLTLPDGAAVVTDDPFTTNALVTATSYNPSNIAVGAATIPAGFTRADATGAPRAWTGTILVELPAITAGADDAATTAARNTAKTTAITNGLMVDINVAAEAAQATLFVSGPMEDQYTLASETTVTVVAMTVEGRPTATVTDITATGDDDLTSAVTFTITFDEDVMLTAGHLEVTGGGIVVDTLMQDMDDPMMWTVDVRAFGGVTSVTLTVKDTIVASASSKEAPDPNVDTGMMGDVEIASKGYAVLVNPGATASHTGIDDDVTTIAYDLLDLYEFFRDSGTIVLEGPSATAFGAVRMTEIMWGQDAALTDPTMSQWIEIQNTTGAAITVNFGTGGGWSLDFKEEEYDNSTADAVDRISNLGNPGQWAVPGSNGRSEASADEDQKELVSMVRKHTDARSHRSDGWEAAIRPSVNIDGARIANPGSAKRVIEAGGTAPSIDRSSVFISEIGNLGDGSDWIELYNSSDSAVNIKNWIISTVTAADVGGATDAQLTAGNTEGGGIDKEVVQFARATYEDALKIPAKSYLLVTAKDPADSDSPLAVGINLLNTKVDRDPKENETTGQIHLYYVASGLKIPNEAALVILRNHHEREGRSANFRDVVNLGDYAGSADVNVNIVGSSNDNSWNTEVWPLESTRKPGDREPAGEGRGDSANAIIQRDIGKTNHWAHKDLWSAAPFTGLGYDRDIDNEATTQGTPGYANGGGLEKIADLKDGDITISEIMYANGNGRIPQWIELYNSSTTRSVNLKDWDLEINNVDSADVMTNEYINRRITLGDVKVLPNQTVLIVSTSGRNTGRDMFPSHRTIDLSSPDAFGRDNRLDPILSSTGFNIALYDKDDKFVDEAGNIDDNRRTNDEPAWDLPNAETEDGRASIIRRYNEGTASRGGGGMADGTLPVWSGEGSLGDAGGMGNAGWILASNANLSYLNIGDLYYGRATDISTPGFRGGGPLPVSLSKFRPERMKDTGQIVIRWITESELNNAGFNILRSEARDGEFTKLNTKLIAGQGTTSERTTYEYADTSAKPNVVYYYQIQDVSLEGQVNTLATTHLRGNVSAAGKLTTTWGELKALQ